MVSASASRPSAGRDGARSGGLERFAVSAPSAMRVVRGFGVHVQEGDARGEDVAACLPAVDALRRASKALGLDAMTVALDGFDEALTGASDIAPDEEVPTSARGAIVSRYATLVTLLPSAFSLESELTQREGVLLEALLRQIPSVNALVLGKLHACGVRSVDALEAIAEPSVLATLAGIALPLAARILDKVHAHARDRKAGASDPRHAFERERLMALAARLRFQHEGYEEASKGWTDEAAAQKKKLRQSRTDTFLQVKVLLARMGELERLAQLDRLPFERKVDALEEFLDRVDGGDSASS